MTAKEYLKQIGLLDAGIKQKRMQVDELYRLSISLKSVQTGKEKVQTSLSGDALSENVLRYLDLQSELNSDISNLINKKNEIIKQIQGLDDIRCIHILFKKYIEYKSLKIIADEMHYNYNRIRHLHRYALRIFDEKYLKDDTQ